MTKREDTVSLTWSGREAAWAAAETPPRGRFVLRSAESLNEKGTDNLFIEGENLAVMKLLRADLSGKVGLIYIDPPYNTGRDLLYRDDFGGDYRCWLDLMAPRLLLARELLSEDGVMFIAIDDGALAYLKLLCEEIFGADNVEVMIWQKVGHGDAGAGRMKVTRRFRKEHEYIITCYKQKKLVRFEKYMALPHFKRRYGNSDGDPRGPYKGGNISKTEQASNPQGKNYYAVTSPDGCRVYRRQWHFDRAAFDRLVADNRIYWGQSGHGVPQLKVFQYEERPTTPVSVLTDIGSATSANKELRRLFGEVVFPHSKPVSLLTYLIKLVPVARELIVLDFFAGSAATAHAVLQANIDDGKRRRFIMVQQAEICPPQSAAARAGFPHIAAVASERIRRAAAALIAAQPSDDPLPDMGFRYYRWEE